VLTTRCVTVATPAHADTVRVDRSTDDLTDVDSVLSPQLMSVATANVNLASIAPAVVDAVVIALALVDRAEQCCCRCASR
jgi:hypothetical protein